MIKHIARRRTEWLPCHWCGATTRHDRGYCIRDSRHHLAEHLRTVDPLLVQHTPDSPTYRKRRWSR